MAPTPFMDVRLLFDCALYLCLLIESSYWRLMSSSRAQRSSRCDGRSDHGDCRFLREVSYEGRSRPRPTCHNPSSSRHYHLTRRERDVHTGLEPGCVRPYVSARKAPPRTELP